jgi:plastocyanin
MTRLDRFFVSVLLLFCGTILFSRPETVTVTGSVSVGKAVAANAVIWLKPAGSAARHTADIPSSRPRFKILQHHKRFDPHVLAVPVGSIIDFPNLDPFFHNVFSMFDGKRFDLGLYEAGTSHAVTFDSPGVCYIFCNIHPEMSAAVVVVDSPYYATSNETGHFAIPNVPPGAYLFYIWHERGKPEGSVPRQVTITSENPSVGAIPLVDAGELLGNHKNKYGRDYEKSGDAIYK